MTAIALLDVLTGGSVTTPKERHHAQLTNIAVKLVEASLVDWQRIREYEHQVAMLDFITSENLIEVKRSLRVMYNEWAVEADQVLTRVREFAAAGYPIDQVDALEDAFAQVTNRLAITPEQITQALDQIGQGQGVPIQELRDELHARIRAGR